MTAAARRIWAQYARRTARLAFRLIIAVTLVYFAMAVAAHWAKISEWRPGARGIATVIAATLGYGASLYLLAELWHRLVNGTQTTGLGRSLTFPSYAVTQIAKYLPGNVFQFVGRHIWLTRKGAAQSGLVVASALEVAVMILGAGLVVVIGTMLTSLPVVAVLAEFVSPPVVALAFAVVLVALIGALAVLRRNPGRFALPAAGVLIRALALAMLFFAGQGAVFFLLSRLVAPDVGAAVMVIATASWLLGYLTPGAPGGIGVREVVMLLLLRPMMPEADAVIAVSLFRLVTTLGDLICYLAGIALWRGDPAQERR